MSVSVSPKWITETAHLYIIHTFVQKSFSESNDIEVLKF